MLSIQQRMQAAGFQLETTGGECTAYVRNAGDIEELVTLANEAKAPQSLSDAVAVGIQLDGVDADAVAGYTLADVLAALENPSDEYVLLSLRLYNGFHRVPS